MVQVCSAQQDSSNVLLNTEQQDASIEDSQQIEEIEDHDMNELPQEPTPPVAVSEPSIEESKDIMENQQEASLKAEPVELNGDAIEYKAEEGKFIATGNVLLRQDNALLYCDRIEFYRDRKEAHAYGNVVLESDQGVVWAEKGFYNFDTRRGEFTKARIFANPVFGYATRVTKVRDNYYILSDGWLSTSDYDDPEYRIRAKQIEILPKVRATASGTSLYFGGIPVAYLHKYTHNLQDRNSQIRVVPGYKKSFGVYLLTSYRVRPIEKIETTFHADYRDKKGFAWGIDLKYDPTWLGQGLFRSYYMNERTLSDHFWKEERFVVEEIERYRLEWRHQINIDPTLSFISQYYLLSDRDILKTYFEREYRNDQTPDTFAVLTKTLPNAFASLRVDARVNTFEDSVQRLPEANVTWTHQPIGDTGFYVKSANTITNLTKESGAIIDERHQTWRANTDTEISRPIKVGFLEVRPYVGTQQTYYSQDKEQNNGADMVRGIFKTGVDVSSRFSRIYPITYKKFGIEINELRHSLMPTLSYFYQHAPTRLNESFYLFDDMDARFREHRLTPAITSLFQTKRNGKTVNLLRSRLSMNYYLQDNTYLEDAYDLSSAIERNRRGGWGNTRLENEVYLNQHVSIYQDATYSNDEERLEESSVSLFIRDLKKTSFGIGHNYTHEHNNLITTQMSYRFNPKWKIQLYEQFDMDTGDWREQQYCLTRDLHSWEMSFSWKDKRGYQDDSQEMWVVFTLKAFPSVSFNGSGGVSRMSERRVGSN